MKQIVLCEVLICACILFVNITSIIHNFAALLKICVRHRTANRHSTANHTPTSTSTIPSTSTLTREDEEPPIEPLLQIGMLVALYLSQYRDELPLIGRVISIPMDGLHVEIEWLVGSYNAPWHLCKKRVDRKYVPWTKFVPKSSILSTVELTRSQRLSECMTMELGVLQRMCH